MHAEQLEIIDFLRRTSPFTELPDEALAEVAGQVEVAYYKAGSPILSFAEEIHHWYLIRSGAVEVFRRNGELYNRLSEGGFFGEFGLLRNNRVRFPVTALEDTLVYLIAEPLFNRLFEAHERFADLVEVEDQTRLRHAVERQKDANPLLNAPAETLIGRPPLCLTADASARTAAQRMSEEGASSLLIRGPGADDRAGLVGILTDRDLRDRLLAPGLPYDTPVSQIMSTDLHWVRHSEFVFEAMLLMLRHNLHHLPVLKRDQVLGVIALSDIIRHESQNSLFVVRSIYQAQSLEELVALRQDVRASFSRMVNEDANSRMIGGAMAMIGRSFKQRLLELGEEKLGEPPVPYCFLALGSMAREEQLIVTDQDNAMILDNRYDASLHEGYFRDLAEFVCDGLAACGYSYCSGKIMASNPQWRQPLRVWEENFSQWIEQPTAEFLLHSSIFFDLEGVWGNLHWADMLNQLIRRKARQNRRFLAAMARNALHRTPPLGFFKGFVMETDGQHSHSINMKRRGTAPLADLLRVHGLSVGSQARNSFERLRDVIDANILPPGRGPDLRDALELISMVRIRHQALDLEAGREPDNRVEPDNLSDFERKNLKDAFQILSNAQKFLRYRYA
ncbi:cyclic nucleotide-binding/CBS domain-containing protein [Magnetovirga frankeli]|uniref:DUF294 nucleotidyltransferase-like domain-containing protein n=1 Tax=Magnetovirga frankeli TaxID=947516 RepID=UPI001293A885|nr:cyclic nucleotide-binding/CBS domain-containing protein [gamma proteobacterium SS-5]